MTSNSPTVSHLSSVSLTSGSASLAGLCILGTQKKSEFVLEISLQPCYNVHMKETISYFNLAMDLSRTMFAYHLCGVLTSLHGNNLPAPDPEKEALEYLETFHAEALAEKQEADANNQTPEWSLS